MTDPLRIATLPIGANNGAVGITFAPGKHQAQAMSGIWKRDLDLDLRVICDWGASHLITLLESWELEELRITNLAERAQWYGLQWHWLPITDGAAPDERFLRPWRRLGPSLVGAIHGGERVVVHCKGGLGRAGTVASLLLIDSSEVTDAASAVCRVRAVRPGAIETAAQETFLQGWSDSSRTGGD